jgi:hypothetical protein
MKTKAVALVLLGVPFGVALTFAAKNVLPIMEHLPAGGGRCVTCHDLHGAVVLDELHTDVWIRLTGDLPKPVWVETAKLFGYERDGVVGVRLLDLLADYGCTKFRQLVIISADGGHVSIDGDDVTDTTLLVRHLDSVRLVDERLPSPSWLHSILEICIVASDPALQIGDELTTFGELVSGSRRQAITEPTRVALDDQDAGVVRRCVLSRLTPGVRVCDLVGPAAGRVTVTAAERSVTFDADEVRNAIICRDERDGRVMLALPDKRRGSWLADVTAVRWQ